MEVFAEIYFAALNEDGGVVPIRSQDATFILSYSVIMLNTDQHNPQVRRRMTIEEFLRNNRGVNDGKDFDPEYMKAIYDEIKCNEIVLPDEHEGDLGFAFAWRELIKNSGRMTGMPCLNTNAHDKDMFGIAWGPTLAAISYAFDNADDSLTLQKAVIGFHHLAGIAATYHEYDIFDSIIISLSKITGLLKESEPSAEGRVDAWAVDFGGNFKGQVATVLMFGLVGEHGNWLRKGWNQVMDCVRNLFVHSLLPPTMLKAHDFVHETVDIVRLPVAVNARVKDKEEGGIFSTLSMFLTGGGGDDDEDIEKGVEAQSIAFGCVGSCKIEDLFTESRYGWF
jgi:brefeldin A-resistance guanine nucleotide exchange factor 1